MATASDSASDVSIRHDGSGEQRLQRTHTFWSLMAYQTTILCSWSCNIVMFYYVFTLGGPASLVWGTWVITIGNTIVMACLAEYVAIWPFAGGQQAFTYTLAPESCRRFLSYFVGWCILVGEISAAAGCALNSADVLAAFLQITHPDVKWKVWMTFLVYLAYLVMPFAFNLTPKLIPGFQLAGAAFNVSCAFVWIVLFLVMAPKTDAAFVFTKFINTSGWTSNGWVFILSMYAPIYGLYGTDAVIHLTEEMKNPRRDAPRVMVWAMIWAGATCFATAAIMCYTATPEWAKFLAADSAYMAWFIYVTKSVYGGGTFCAIIMMGLNFLIIMNMYVAGSRVIWAMSRDKAFPFSKYWAHLDARFDVPLRAMIAFAVMNALIGLLIFGSDLAFYAILSGGGIALQASYCVPILCVLLRGRRILPKERPDWDLGDRWGTILGVISILWSIVVLLFYVFPQYLPVVGDIQDMNWAVGIIAAVFIVAGICWFTTGRKTYLVECPYVLEGTIAVTSGEDSSFEIGSSSKHLETTEITKIS